MPNPLSPLTPVGRSCEDAFRAALRAELGYSIETNSSFRWRNVLYKFRRDNPNPEFDSISIRISPDKPETDLWLINTNGMRQEADEIEL